MVCQEPGFGMGTATLWNVQGGATFVLELDGTTVLVHAPVPPEKGKGDWGRGDGESFCHLNR